MTLISITPTAFSLSITGPNLLPFPEDIRGEMDARSDTLTHLTEQQRHPASNTPQASRTSASSAPRSRLQQPDLVVDEATLGSRTIAQRQINGTPRPLQRRHRQSKSITSRSTLASQPVIVRTYSAETDEPARPSSTMPPRSSSVANEDWANQPAPGLPSVQDFSIEGILRAIEPDIRSTLDNIAEICGRSKLSLANEYGSHLPPQGEIRATGRSMDHGLLPVEEASPGDERFLEDNVAIMGDNPSLIDGRDHLPTPTLEMLENLQQASNAMGYRMGMSSSWGDGSSIQAQPDTPESGAMTDPYLDTEHESRLPPVAEDLAPRPSAGSWALLGRNVEPAGNDCPQNIVTQPVVSEVHLDAGANGRSWVAGASLPYQMSHDEAFPASTDAGIPRYDTSIPQSRAEKLSILADLQSWLAWVKGAAQQLYHEGGYQATSSAESTLREVLERQSMRVYE
jgi:hypothetical protein